LNLDNKTFNRLVFAAVSIGFAAVALAAGAAVWSARENQTFSQRVNHTYEVQRAIGDLRVTAEQLEAARRGYLLQPMDREFLKTYRSAAVRAPKQLQIVRALTADNPSQQRRVDELGEHMLFNLAITDASVDKVTAGGQVAAMREFRADSSPQLLRDIRKITEAMSAEESRLLRLRNAGQERALMTLYGVLAIAMILLTFVGVASLWVISRYTRNLTQSRNALRELNEGLELAVRERTGDLKRANDEIQRFAYIVSHDLRSPLVNVMGFTSELDGSLATLKSSLATMEKTAPALVDTDTRAAIEHDLPEAIGFIRSSTQKMDRLINAILQLSRQGRRVMAPEPLNMAEVLGGVADSLRQRAERATAEIEVETPIPDIVSDRIGVEQVFSNLVENAVKYSKPGRPNRIAVRGEERLGRVIYEVADTGRGIDPKDHERIFELFRRAGVQDQAGEGIGLAHVRALVYRLGGVITCESELDRGATFRVSLPARLLPEQGL